MVEVEAKRRQRLRNSCFLLLISGYCFSLAISLTYPDASILRTIPMFFVGAMFGLSIAGLFERKRSNDDG